MSKIIRSIFILILCASTSLQAQEKSCTTKDSEFVEFLKLSLKNSEVNPENRQKFNRGSWTYWTDHLLDYNEEPKKYQKALSLFHQNQEKYKQEYSIKIDRYEKDIENFRQFDNRNTAPANPILFIGSSSIRYWETAKSFPELSVINRGFGGASLPEIIHYYNDVIKKHSPSIMVVYCDIDVESGKSPSAAVNNFKQLVNKVERDFPQTQILLLAMKPVLIDDFLGKDVRKNKGITNKMLDTYCQAEKNLHYIDIAKIMFKSNGTLRSDIFLSDGMHLNHLGYSLWDPIIKAKLNELSKD